MTLAQASPPPKQSGPRMKADISYKPLTFAQIPGWEEDDQAAAFKAFRKSCERVLAASRERPSADKAPQPTPPPPALSQPARRRAS
jgi:membrane-bound lytic murein transglycosylase A